MGSTHFLTRRLANVSTEMSLHVLAYNLKRVISILGIARDDEGDETGGRVSASLWPMYARPTFSSLRAHPGLIVIA